jgi:putative phosphoribosyl transferase
MQTKEHEFRRNPRTKTETKTMPTATRAAAIRTESAASILSRRLASLRSSRDTVVIARPGRDARLGRAIASSLGLPFDVLSVEDVRSECAPEVTLGAVCGGGVRILDFPLIDRLGLNAGQVSEAVAAATRRADERERLYRKQLPSVDVADRTVVLADDGSAPCQTMLCELRLLRRRHAERIIVATTRCWPETLRSIAVEADEVVLATESGEETAAPAAVC